MSQIPSSLVYSHRQDVRERIMTAVGRRPAPDVGRIEFLECSSVSDVLMAIDDRVADLVILDGEAQPTGGIGISRQIHQEAAVDSADHPDRPTGRRSLVGHLGEG